MKPLRLLGLALALVLTLSTARAEAPLRVGSTPGPLGDIMNFAAAQAKQQGLDVQVIEFTDWITPNEALANGDIDTNLFQHEPFLNAAIKARGYKLVPVAPTTVMPVGLFSHKITRFDQVPDGAVIAIANDPVNGARGLQLLQKAGLLKLRPGVGDDATQLDVTDNPKHLKFRELEAAQLPRALDDVTIAQVSISYLMIAGGDPATSLLSDGGTDPHYALVFAARPDHKDDPRLLKFIAIYRSPAVKQFIIEHYGKYIQPTW
jgi:D-methionine transport system substrate-binding protein